VQTIPAFTGLRGVAALCVVAYHFREELNGHVPRLVTLVLDKGFLAVDLFFILSGFVIYLNYRWMFGEFNLRSLKAFIIARLGRIYPVHLFMSIAFLASPMAILLFSQAKDLGSRYGAAYYVMSLFLIHNWGLTDQVEWNIPSWSISTEWFAYLLFPLFLLGAAQRREKPWAIIGRLASLLSVLAIFFLLANVGSIGDNIPRFGLGRCVLEFMAGIEVCRFFLWVEASRFRIGVAPLTVALGIAIASTVLALPDFYFVPAAFALLVFALTDQEAYLSRVLSWRPLAWLGRISYPVYMVHYYIKDWLKFSGIDDALRPIEVFTLYVALVLAGGVLVHICIEKPGQQIFRAFALRKA
jgi:peptidoglycan/LPS O-acetylase OafA/YrhL